MDIDYLGFDHPGVALVDSVAARDISYRRLAELTHESSERLDAARDVVFVLADGTIESVVDYLGAMASEHVVVLLDAGMDPGFLANLVQSYQPRWLAGKLVAPPHGYSMVRAGLHVRASGLDRAIHHDLKLMLPTSGSTGSPKMVRLSARNVSSNTRSVAASLSLDSSSRAITSLPVHYSYGLSVLQSHLLVGGSVVVTSHSVLERDFWTTFADNRVTSLAGVPYTFQMLRRLKFAPSDYPSLRAMTQAGGRMDDDLTMRFHELLAECGADLYVMYGQTEAAPRIACLPAQCLPEKIGSVGLPVEGGAIFIDEPGNTGTRDQPGEVIYSGSNVMMGYAEQSDDLALGDVCGGVLPTGDLGFLDQDGFLFITGRIKRITKLYGVRVSLDEVERLLADLGPVAAVSGQDVIHVFHSADGDAAKASRSQMAKTMGVTPSSIRMHHIDQLPTLGSGKYDYKALSELVGMS